MSDIAIALGGGGMKGIAHLGVIKKLEEEGFGIRAIAGTSAGGVVGSCFAAGIPIKKIRSALLNLPHKNLFSRRPHDGPSLLGLSGLVEVLGKYLDNKTFEDLQIPFAVTSVDLRTNQEYILHKGKVLEAVQATAAIPGVFPAIRLGHTELVDGGVLDPVPVAVARWLAPKLPIIAVCLSPIPEEWSTLPEFQAPSDTPIPQPLLDQLARMRVGQSVRIFIQAMDITARMIAELRMQTEKPDVIIRPDVHHVGYLDRVNPDELIKAGEMAVTEMLPRIRESLAWYHQLTRQFHSAQPPGKLLDEEDAFSI